MNNNIEIIINCNLILLTAYIATFVYAGTLIYSEKSELIKSLIIYKLKLTVTTIWFLTASLISVFSVLLDNNTNCPILILANLTISTLMVIFLGRIIIYSIRIISSNTYLKRSAEDYYKKLLDKFNRAITKKKKEHLTKKINNFNKEVVYDWINQRDKSYAYFRSEEHFNDYINEMFSCELILTKDLLWSMSNYQFEINKSKIQFKLFRVWLQICYTILNEEGSWDKDKNLELYKQYIDLFNKQFCEIIIDKNTDIEVYFFACIYYQLIQNSSINLTNNQYCDCTYSLTTLIIDKFIKEGNYELAYTFLSTITDNTDVLSKNNHLDIKCVFLVNIYASIINICKYKNIEEECLKLITSSERSILKIINNNIYQYNYDAVDFFNAFKNQNYPSSLLRKTYKTLGVYGDLNSPYMRESKRYIDINDTIVYFLIQFDDNLENYTQLIHSGNKFQLPNGNNIKEQLVDMYKRDESLFRKLYSKDKASKIIEEAFTDRLWI